MLSPTALSTTFLLRKWGLKCSQWCCSERLSVLPITLETFLKLSLILWINKYFRSCNNAASLLNSGTFSTSSTKQNKSYRINCRENYSSLFFLGSVCLSSMFIAYQISLAPLLGRQQPTYKSKQPNKNAWLLSAVWHNLAALQALLRALQWHLQVGRSWNHKVKMSQDSVNYSQIQRWQNSPYIAVGR